MRKVIPVLCLVLVCSSVAFAQGKWRKFHGPEVGPGPRSGHGMVVDEARQKIVLFGGHFRNNEMDFDEGFLDDTWEFDLKTLTWEKKTPRRSPKARKNFAIAYNPISKRIVIHGGSQAEEYDWYWHEYFDCSPSTWEWNGKNWHLITTSGPPLRSDHNMKWDTIGEEFVMHGGRYYCDFAPYCSGYSYKNDTWIYRSGYWNKQSNARRHRAGAILINDTEKDRILMHGGKSGRHSYLPDISEWDGNNWININENENTARAFHAAAYDSDRNILLIFGGYFSKLSSDPSYSFKFLDDTWVFENSKWKQLAIKTQIPAARSEHALVYDSLNKRMWLFGGTQGLYKYNGSMWYYTVHNEFDLKPLFRNVSYGNKLEHGKTARFAVRIHNTGFDESQGQKVSLFLSKDNQLSDDDKLLIKKQFTRHIKPNSKVDLKLSKRISKNIAPGQYYLIVKVVTDKGIDLNKNNNVKVRAKPVEIIRNTDVPAQPGN